MAKAQFHRHQRVYVKPVGTWAHVERIVPYWSREVEEPLRITYDVGLGREFAASELVAEREGRAGTLEAAGWRVFRLRQTPGGVDDPARHPFPGTLPVVVTDACDWGGWRVPEAEYDRDPDRIEHQARLIAHAPRMLKVLRALVDEATDASRSVPSSLMPQAREAARILREVYGLAPDLDEADPEPGPVRQTG